MNHYVAGLNEGQHERRDRRHSARESERVIGVFPHREPILEDLLVGTVEA